MISDAQLRQFSAPDSLTSLRNTEIALGMAREMGFEDAMAKVERRVEAAFRNHWSGSKINWCGVLLAFRKASRKE